MVCALSRPGDLAGHAQRPLHCGRVPDGLLSAPPRHQAPLRAMTECVALLLLPLQARIQASVVQSCWQAVNSQNTVSMIPEGQGHALPELRVGLFGILVLGTCYRDKMPCIRLHVGQALTEGGGACHWN